MTEDIKKLEEAKEELKDELLKEKEELGLTDKESDKDSENKTDEKFDKDSEKKLDEDSEKKSDENSDNKSDKKKESEKEDEHKVKIPILDLETSTPYIDSSVEKRKKAKRVRKVILVCVLTFLLFVYIGGVIYHYICFGRATSVNGFDVSMKNAKSADLIITNDMNKYKLDIEFLYSDETITLDDGVFTIDTEYTMNDMIKSQNPFLWPINIWKSHDLTVKYVVSVDEDKLNQLLDSYECMNEDYMRAPEDAYVSLLGGEAHIVPEGRGSIVKVDDAKKVIYEALSEMKDTVNLYDEDCYVKANVLSDDEKLLSIINEANKYLSIKAVYDFKGYKIQLTKEDLAQMATITESGKVVVDENKVKSFTKSFADSHSTSNTYRKFKTHDDKMILVYGGYYGWILNAEKEAPLLYESLKNYEDFDREFVCDRIGYTYCDLNDIGENYVEIDLTNQHVYVYEKNIRVYDTPCVTGNVSWGMSTPGGIYPLTYKTKNAILRGPGYATPVAYWMPFNGGIGMHDATWKKQFGGEIYKLDGSHGCINLPLEAAAAIYPYVETGSPIVCYWLDEVEILEE